MDQHQQEHSTSILNEISVLRYGFELTVCRDAILPFSGDPMGL